MEWNGSPRLSTQSNKMQAAEQFKRKTKNVWFRNQKIIADLIEFGATKFVIIRKGMLAFIAQTYIKGLRWWVDEPISDNKINDLEIKKTYRKITYLSILYTGSPAVLYTFCDMHVLLMENRFLRSRMLHGTLVWTTHEEIPPCVIQC